jgi:hypothetical protein
MDEALLMADSNSIPDEDVSTAGDNHSSMEDKPSSSSSSLLTLPPLTAKKRRSFTIEQKLEVVRFAKSSSRNAASRKFNIARHCVSQWLRNEEDLMELQ